MEHTFTRLFRAFDIPFACIDDILSMSSNNELNWVFLFKEGLNDRSRGFAILYINSVILSFSLYLTHQVFLVNHSLLRLWIK